MRLGYACINLTLQGEKGGCRFRNLTVKRLAPMSPQERRAHLYQAARSNLQAVSAILRWNAAHEIRLYRLTSDLIPLATHPVAADWDWQFDLAEEFAAVAAVAVRTGARLTMHPGQYTVLNARERPIVEQSMVVLTHQARMLEMLKTGAESGLVLHVGGGYGDKEAAARRFAATFAELPPEVAGRIWIENDDTTWDTAEAFAVARSVERPMVFDIHHHRVLRSDDWLPWLQQILPTWGEVRPKVHFSSPKDQQRPRVHADLIDPGDFRQFLARTEGIELDVMLECKAKDQALLKLRADLDSM